MDATIANFSGEIVLPGDASYETAATTFSRKGKPAIILRPRSSQDVVVAVDHAKKHNLLISVRSGGHSGAGLSTNDGGAVIDLSLMNTVEVLDTAQHLVRIGSGAVWGEVARVLGEHGLAISSGDTTTVGVGGLTLGGGIGWMVRKFGLTIDSLVAAEVVTAGGDIVRASAEENSDLFWAIRGGSGNFGVVTYFEFTGHKVGNVFAGPVTYTQDNLPKLLKDWRDVMRAAPRELTSMFLVLPSFGGNPAMVVINCCYAGDDKSAAMQAVQPLLELGNVLGNAIEQKTYAEVLEKARPPQGMRVIVNNTFINTLSDEAVTTIAAQSGQILQIRSLGGAVADVPVDGTAFAHRNSEVMVVAPTFVGPKATADEVAAALAPWRNIEALGSGSYSNFLSEVNVETTSKVYPQATYQRLAKIKQHYDPGNLFNQNSNIEPLQA